MLAAILIAETAKRPAKILVAIKETVAKTEINSIYNV